MKSKYVLGIDFSATRVTVALMDVHCEKAVYESFEYPKRKERKYCDANSNQFRLHPADILESLENVLKRLWKKNKELKPETIEAITISAPTNTICPVDSHSNPLCLLPEYENNPDTMFWSNEDHSSKNGFEKIAEICADHPNWKMPDNPITAYSWTVCRFYQYILNHEGNNPATKNWIELGDWIVGELIKNNNPEKSVCFDAGNASKMYLNENILNFLLKRADSSISTTIKQFEFRKSLPCEVQGLLKKKWAEKWGLKTDVKVGVAVNRELCAIIGADISNDHLVRFNESYSKDFVVTRKDKAVKGNYHFHPILHKRTSSYDAYVSIENHPGMFGDVYGWFRELIVWPVREILDRTDFLTKKQKQKIVNGAVKKLIDEISKNASYVEAEKSLPLALDWLSSQKLPPAIQLITGAVSQLTRGTEASEIFRAWLEVTAVESFKYASSAIDQGLVSNGIILLSEKPGKDNLFAEILCNIFDLPVTTFTEDHPISLGAALIAIRIITSSSDWKPRKSPHKTIKVFNPEKDKTLIYKNFYHRLTSYEPKEN